MNKEDKFKLVFEPSTTEKLREESSMKIKKWFIRISPVISVLVAFLVPLVFSTRNTLALVVISAILVIIGFIILGGILNLLFGVSETDLFYIEASENLDLLKNLNKDKHETTD